MELLHRLIFGIVLLYLSKKYHVKNYRYEITHSKGTLGSLIKKHDMYYVLFNPSEHERIDEVVNTAFHEFAHILQYEIIQEDTLEAWIDFIGDDHGSKYFYSAVEVAARAFARTHGKVDMVEIFDDYEPIQACSHARLVARGRRIARKYNVDR